MTAQRSFCDSFAIHASRLGPAGLSPKAPGTVGSAVAIILAPLVFMPLPIWLRLAVLAGIFFWGSLLISRAENLLGLKDPGEIVLDELVGQWLTVLPFASLSFEWMVLAFVLFRVFDILKPYPVRDSEKWLPGGWGVMVDDVMAGLYAMVSLGILHWIFT